MIIASIDIGTNTVLLLVGSVNERTGEITPILNEYRMPRIGRGLIPGKDISNDRIKSLFEVLSDYQQIIVEKKVEKVLITATNAFRIAANSSHIVDEIKAKFGYDTNIISGETEAEYAFLGAVPSFARNKTNLIIDIGGGSTELIIGKNRRIKYSESFQIGSVSATESYLQHSPPAPDELMQLDKILHIRFNKIKNMLAPDLAVAIAGTPTTLVCMIKGLEEFDEASVEGSYLSYRDLFRITEELKTLAPTEIKNRFGNVMRGREDIILGGSIILLKIMKLLNLQEVMVSSRGIRYGAIVHYMMNKK